MVVFESVENDHQRGLVASLAKEIWHDAYQDLLSVEQREYMIEKLQSFEAIKHDGMDYFLIYFDEVVCGYYAITTEDECLLISKIYILNNFRGKGILSKIIDKCKNESTHQCLRLYVNKENPALKAYEAKGFEIVRSVVKDIGEGYVMDDYCMEFEL